MNINGFSCNWVDLAVLIVLGLGLYRGRSRGMSTELLDVMKWLAIVVAAGFIYRPVGKMAADYFHFTPRICFVCVYLGTIVLIRMIFEWMKRVVGEKLIGSDVFGSWEYYLGMMAGAIRFACYLITAMALLNADYVSKEQLAATARMQREAFEDISFPTIGTIQQTVFAESASGKFAKRYLAHELIVTTASDQRAPASETLGKQRERLMYEALGK